jgi:hypothetical protein
MNEAVGSAFSGGARSPPSSQEGLAAARVLNNELDAARFDPLLVKNVAKSAVKAIDAFVDRAGGLVRDTISCLPEYKHEADGVVPSQIITDYTATSLAGQMPTNAQQLNAELASALYHFWSPMNRVVPSYPSHVQDILKISVDVSQTFQF